MDDVGDEGVQVVDAVRVESGSDTEYIRWRLRRSGTKMHRQEDEFNEERDRRAVGEVEEDAKKMGVWEGLLG